MTDPNHRFRLFGAFSLAVWIGVLVVNFYEDELLVRYLKVNHNPTYVRLTYFPGLGNMGHANIFRLMVAETKDLDENTVLDLDRDGNIYAITIEHARDRTEIPTFSYEQVGA